MNISSAQVDLIRGWFARIEHIATDRKTYNNKVMSPNEALSEIKVLAKEAKEYIERNIT